MPFDATTGVAVSGFPEVKGSVYAVVPDGAGGWYIGGSFTSVGGFPRMDVAHILSNNTISPWNPNANGAVRAMVLSAGTVYVGGEFTTIASQARSYIAALDGAAGSAVAWNPNANAPVLTLAVSGTTIYAGGSFTSIGGQTRNHAAGLDVSNGLATNFDPNADYDVRTMIVSGSLVYAGGAFTNIGGQIRGSIAALDGSSGLATPWNPNPSYVYGTYVNALAMSGNVVYVSGQFSNIGDRPAKGLAALDASSGLATAGIPAHSPAMAAPS